MDENKLLSLIRNNKEACVERQSLSDPISLHEGIWLCENLLHATCSLKRLRSPSLQFCLFNIQYISVFNRSKSIFIKTNHKQKIKI